MRPVKKLAGSANLLTLSVAAVAVVVSAAALWLYVGSRPPGNDSPEVGFARDMMVHHAQAVEMAEIAKDRTENGEVRTLATDIVLTQQAQIGQMQGWLAIWGLPYTGTEPAMAWTEHPMEGMMPGMATQEQVNALSDVPPEEMDKRFLRLMIEHHRAAIPMAEAVLERTDRPAVQQLAEAITNSQRAEISVMQNMLWRMGEEPSPAKGDTMMEDDRMDSMMGGGQMQMMGSFDEDKPFDLQFIDQMIMHHQGAIVSSEHMISDSERPELRRLAKSIQESQSEQIEQMQEWRERWYPDAEQTFGMMNPTQMGEMMGGSMQDMMGGEMTDAMFLRMMIPHHQLAIEMSEQALEEAEHPELKELARKIIAEQSAEIELMRGYLEEIEASERRQTR